jgi:uncharacterized protein VirK/YbjX
VIFINSKNNAVVLDYNTNSLETLDFSKYNESDLGFMLSSKPHLEVGNMPQVKKESPYFELSDPNKHPIFDISFNKIEKKLFILGIDYLKAFKIYDFTY